MSASPSIDDILFCFEHMAGASRLPAWDRGTLLELLEPYAQLMAAEVAPLNASGDQQGAQFNNGRVTLPDGFVEAFRAYAQQGWQGLSLPEAYGGQGLEEMGLANLALALTSELMSSANHSFQMLVGLSPGLARVLLRFGTVAQKQRILPMIASGETLATMALTEPQAGSDLSRIKCRAVSEGAQWRLSGEKIFISNGDQDASPHITHLVLARTSDEGVKGLSLFLCPSQLNDGARNAVQTLRIEDKLGLKASPTCHLVFNEAEAEIIGQPGEGLKLMFEMMNHARLDVALQGVAHAARASQLATTYAEGRVQGGKSLSQHPDVARMLDEAERLAWSARAIAQLGFVEMELKQRPGLVDLLTPLAKVYCSNAGTKAADQAVQVMGGYGYLKDYHVEQILRDSRICAIYEGANGIHEASLVTRHLKAEEPYTEFADLVSENAELAEPLVSWQHAAASLVSLADPKPLANAFTDLSACLLLMLLWRRAEAAADAQQDLSKITRFRRLADADFLVATAKFKALYDMRIA